MISVILGQIETAFCCRLEEEEKVRERIDERKGEREREIGGGRNGEREREWIHKKQGVRKEGRELE